MASRKDVRFRMVAQDATATGLRSVRDRFERLSRTIKGVFVGGALFAGVLSGLQRIGEFVDRNIEKFADLAKKASEINLSPQAFSELANVGELIGVAEERLAQLVVKFRTGNETINDALRKLGINIERFSELAAGDQLAVVAQQLNRISDPATRTAAAVELVGDDLARSLLRIARAGAGSIQNQLSLQRALGSEFVNQASKDAEEIQDSVTLLGQAWDNVVASSLSGTRRFANSLLDATGLSALWANQTVVNIDRVRESFGVLADERVAAQQVDFITQDQEKQIEDAAKALEEANKERERSLKEINREVKRLREEQERAEEAVLDNLISRLERVRDSLSEDREVIDALGGRSNLAPARQGLGAVEQGLAVLEQQKTNKLLDELVRFARTGNPAVFS